MRARGASTPSPIEAIVTRGRRLTLEAKEVFAMAKETETNREAERGQQPAVRSSPSTREHGLTRSDPFETSWSGGPFGFMRRMMDEMDRMFDDLGFQGSRTERSEAAGAQAWTPRVDVRHRDGELVVRADLPGVRQEDVEVDVEAGALRIRGERREEHQEGEGRNRRTEVMYGSFLRTIPLPKDADVDKAAAHFSNGVLEVTVPVAERRGRRIEIGAHGPQGGATTH
jgi:HSP20 family protein